MSMPKLLWQPGIYTHCKYNTYTSKGHQDKQQPVHKLTKPAQYNINCNHRAANTLPDLALYSMRQPTYPLPSAYPHLRIASKVVIKDLQGSLPHAAITPAYRSYLQDKFHWTADYAQEVNWNALMMTIKHFAKDHQQISKIIHKWLPLLGTNSSTATPNTLCLQ